MGTPETNHLPEIYKLWLLPMGDCGARQPSSLSPVLHGTEGLSSQLALLRKTSFAPTQPWLLCDSALISLLEDRPTEPRPPTHRPSTGCRVGSPCRQTH